MKKLKTRTVRNMKKRTKIDYIKMKKLTAIL